MREAIWTPLILIVGYLFIVGFFHAGIEDLRKSRVKLTFSGKRRSIKPRAANESVSSVVGSLAAQIGLKAPKTFVIPRIYHVVDAYAVGNQEEPTILMTGGLALLSTRTDDASRSQFEVIVRHELAHLLRNDPSIFATIAAILRVSIGVLVLKVLLIGYFGVERMAGWYRPILPRSFLSVANQGLFQITLPSRTVLATVLTTNVLLLLVLALLYWLWVRKREYWADRAAIDSLGDESLGVNALKRALTGSDEENRPAHEASNRRFWHPRTSARIKVAKSKTPRRGIYTGTATLLLVSTIFLVRYVLGNNSGFGRADYPDSFFIFALSLLYFIAAYFSMELLVFPIGYSPGKGSRTRNLISLFTVIGVTLMVTLIAMSADASWSTFTSKATVQNTMLSKIGSELFERQLMLVSLGISLIVFAVIAYVRGQFVPIVSRVFGVAVAAVIIFGLSQWGRNIVAKSRTVALSSPVEDTSLKAAERALAGLAHTVLGLDGGLYPFRPPLDVFTLNRGPTSVATLNDERLAGAMSLVLRERVKEMYRDLRSKTSLPELDDFTLLSYVGDLFPETSDQEKREMLEALANHQPLTREQTKLFERGLYSCALQGEFDCVRLAGALGANFRLRWVDEFARDHSLVSDLCHRAPLNPKELETLRILLEGGADANVGMGLFHVVSEGDLLATHLLFKHGANPNLTREADPEEPAIRDARTLLQAAVVLPVSDDKDGLHIRHEMPRKVKEALIEYLLNHGADMNAAPQFAMTALMMAANRCEPSVVRILVRHGADKELRDYRDRSALEHARPQVDNAANPIEKFWASAKIERAECGAAANELLSRN